VARPDGPNVPAHPETPAGSVDDKDAVTDVPSAREGRPRHGICPRVLPLSQPTGSCSSHACWREGPDAGAGLLRPTLALRHGADSDTNGEQGRKAQALPVATTPPS
jgi:hypothetical protein